MKQILEGGESLILPGCAYDVNSYLWIAFKYITTLTSVQLQMLQLQSLDYCACLFANGNSVSISKQFQQWFE